MAIEEIQKVAEVWTMEKSEIESIKAENVALNQKLGDIRNSIMERQAKYKEDNEMLIEKVHNMFARDAKTDKELDELVELFLPINKRINEQLIYDQNQVIQALDSRCKSYENDLAKLRASNLSFMSCITT